MLKVFSWFFFKPNKKYKIHKFKSIATFLILFFKIRNKNKNKYKNLCKFKSICKFIILYFKHKSVCSICLNYINYHDKQLLCNHRFHQKCIDIWLAKSNTCPLCKSYHYDYNFSFIFQNNDFCITIDDHLLDFVNFS